MEEPQRTNIDFTWEVLLLCSRRRRGHVSSNNKPGLKHGNMLYTAHMPLSLDGSYIYIYGLDLENQFLFIFIMEQFFSSVVILCIAGEFLRIFIARGKSIHAFTSTS
jgi:hypothetical protein